MEILRVMLVVVRLEEIRAALQRLYLEWCGRDRCWISFQMQSAVREVLIVAIYKIPFLGPVTLAAGR